MIDILIILLKPALRYTDDKSTPWWRLDLFLCALAAWLLDTLIAHTTWAGMYGWPQRGEWTISHTLERLCHPDNSKNVDYLLLLEIARKINRIAPGHIKVIGDA